VCFIIHGLTSTKTSIVCNKGFVIHQRPASEAGYTMSSEGNLRVPFAARRLSRRKNCTVMFVSFIFSSCNDKSTRNLTFACAAHEERCKKKDEAQIALKELDLKAKEAEIDEKLEAKRLENEAARQRYATTS